jgi:hypothetical protein
LAERFIGLPKLVTEGLRNGSRENISGFTHSFASPPLLTTSAPACLIKDCWVLFCKTYLL